MTLKAKKIYSKPNMSKKEKIDRLNELIVDCKNELDAQAENMRPIKKTNDTEEELRVASNYLQRLNS